jgi:acylphosphatase
MLMKLKAIIRGDKVHEVGYRFFLFTKSMELGCQGFFARNQSDGIKQLVLALIEGNQQQLAEFKEFVQATKPEGSNVEDIAFEDYSGSIMSTDAFMHYFTADQLNKGIPALLRIDSKQDRMLEKQDRMLEKQDETIFKLEEIRSDIVLEIKTSREDVVAKLDENRRPLWGRSQRRKRASMNG